MRTQGSNRRIAVGALALLLLLVGVLLGAVATAPGSIQAHPVKPTDDSGAQSRQAARADAVRFDVAGDLTGLAPGVWREVPVRVTNPSGVPLRLTGVTLAVGPVSTPPGCVTATNLEVRQPVFASGRVLPVPPRATVTLPAEGATTAAIRLRDLPGVNQDVCKDKSFTLVWSGTAEQ